MDKSPDAFRTISEVADQLETPAHVLRFWESRFPQIRPVKRAGGRRYYRPSDVALLTGIKRLLHDEGLTIRGVQKILRDHGVRHVAGLSDETVALDSLIAMPEAAEATAEGPPPEATAAETAGEIPEAAFIAIEDEDEDEVVLPEPPPPPRPRPPPVQPVLPLFEAAAARAPEPRPPASPRDDATFASRIRRLPAGSLAAARPELARIAGRLAALRARLADRAEGGSA
ncbi:MerR family transcriptional regulator [Tabrizicola sp.]|uniref:MerR family transcriptional regulator n=1 Tax=Tabrizicola sp. TaxID=2005166 RepID=UPI0035B34F0C